MHYSWYFVCRIILLPYVLQKGTEFHSFLAVKENENICIRIYDFPFNFFLILKLFAVQQSNFMTDFATKLKQIL